MAFTRFGTALLGAAFAIFAASSAQAFQAPVITLTQPLYEVGDTPTMTVTGAPGDALYLLVDRAPGSNPIPGIGTIEMAMGSQFEVHPMGTLPASGIFTGSCHPDCASIMIEAPTLLHVITLDAVDGSNVQLSNLAVVEVQRGDECNNCPKTPFRDPIFSQFPSGGAVYLNGIGDDFVFAAGASFAEYADGTARLTGEIYRPLAPNERFLLDTQFTGYLGLGDGPAFPPIGSPKLELLPSAYDDMGGPVSPGAWHYYTGFSGLLIGIDDFTGGVIAIDRAGPAFQFGQGANGKNLTYGGSGWLNVNIVTQPTNTTWAATGSGDIAIDVGDCPPLEDPICVIAAAPDTFSPQQQLAPHAVVMFQLDGKFLFTGNGGTYTEFPDGTARMQGEIVSVNDANKRWNIDLLFGARIDAGAPTNPPPGSPKLELLDSAYVANGGPIDPATWHYFEDTIGTFTGAGIYDGASLFVTRRGPAFQVGDGANGKNIELGAALWTFFDVISQPTQGPALQLLTEGDINVRFVPCPKPTNQ